ncbi:C-glycoside deglycosidase beta subunit domain-containing protein [Pedococcus sp. P5_B7]
MATHNTLFQPKDVSLRPGGLAISVQLPWYRSLWLSAVKDVAVRVDGQEVPREDLQFVLRDKAYRVEELPDQWDTLWFLQDRVDVVIPWEPTTGPFSLELTLELRLLYMQIAPGRYVPNRVVVEKTIDPAALTSAA